MVLKFQVEYSKIFECKVEIYHLRKCLVKYFIMH